MGKSVVLRSGETGVCSACMDARGITKADLTDECQRSSLGDLTDWTLRSDRVRAV